MRMAFVLLGLFLVFVSVRARELNQSERVVMIPYENNTKKVRQYFLDQIDPSTLSWGEWLAFKGLKRSCDPLRLHILKIQEEEAEFPDQSEKLLGLYGLCSEGVLNLGGLYIKGQ